MMTRQSLRVLRNLRANDPEHTLISPPISVLPNGVWVLAGRNRPASPHHSFRLRSPNDNARFAAAWPCMTDAENAIAAVWQSPYKSAAPKEVCSRTGSLSALPVIQIARFQFQSFAGR